MNPTQPSCEIVTVTNDLGQHAQMRRSFESAGFTAGRARFTVYNNSSQNQHDPYEILRTLPADGPEPYVIFCHQDIRLDLDHGYEQFAAQVALLNARHPRWVAAGNAGGGEDGRLFLHLDEPTGRWREQTLPVRVRSLDENFLLLRRKYAPFCSPGLHGFHLYATDVCLNAIVRGGSAHVIDFLLSHASRGNRHSPAFAAAQDGLVRYWDQQFLAGIIRTTCTEFVLGCSTFVHMLLSKRRARNFFSFRLGNPLIRNPWCHR